MKALLLDIWQDERGQPYHAMVEDHRAMREIAGTLDAVQPVPAQQEVEAMLGTDMLNWQAVLATNIASLGAFTAVAWVSDEMDVGELPLQAAEADEARRGPRVRHLKQRPAVTDIFLAAERVMGVPAAALCRPSRRTALAQAQAATALLLRRWRGASYPEIGLLLGRPHSSVMYMVKARASDPDVARLVEASELELARHFVPADH